MSKKINPRFYCSECEKDIHYSEVFKLDEMHYALGPLRFTGYSMPCSEECMKKYLEKSQEDE